MNMCNREHDLTGRSGGLPKDVTLELRSKELFSQRLPNWGLGGVMVLKPCKISSYKSLIIDVFQTSETRSEGKH